MCMGDKITTIEGLAEMIQRTMASKEDLQRFATKEDMGEIRAEMATKEDMEAGFFAVNRRIDLLREDISDLPEIREAVKDHDERLGRVEQKVGFAT